MRICFCTDFWASECYACSEIRIRFCTDFWASECYACSEIGLLFCSSLIRFCTDFWASECYACSEIRIRFCTDFWASECYACSDFWASECYNRYGIVLVVFSPEKVPLTNGVCMSIRNSCRKMWVTRADQGQCIVSLQTNTEVTNTEVDPLWTLFFSQWELLRETLFNLRELYVVSCTVQAHTNHTGLQSRTMMEQRTVANRPSDS
jgi:hypothetical protein